LIIAIQGTKGFSDYSVFMNAMGRALVHSNPEDKEVTVFSAGPVRVNAMAKEFVNVSEQGFRARGRKIKLVLVPPSWIDDNLSIIDYFAFLSLPKEPLSPQAKRADAKSANLGIHRY
jgi:hypothetical protein